MDIISQPTSFAPWEDILALENLTDARHDLVVVSGYANFNEGILTGNPGSTDSDNDKVWKDYEVHMLVGPLWSSLLDVSPTVTPAGFHHGSSDEADATGYEMLNCTWDFAPGPANKKVELIAQLRSRGGPNASITKLAYHLVAFGILAGKPPNPPNWFGPKQ